MKQESLNDQKLMLTEAQKAFSDAKFFIGCKQVSEYRFFKSILDENKVNKKSKMFYWTDKRVMLLLECLDISITDETLADFKQCFRI